VNDKRSSQQVSALGASTSVWQYGTGDQLLVLVHGFRGDHHGLEGIARELSEAAPELRILVPDLPGFGQSPSVPGRVHDLQLYGEWLREFVGALGAEGHGYAILGHSFGSLVVSSAIAQGLSPAQLVLINPISAPALEGSRAIMTQLAICYYKLAALLPERPARRLLGNRFIVRMMSEVMAKTRDRRLRRWIHDQHQAYFSQFADSETLLQAFRASVSHTVPEYICGLSTPTLLVAGEKDDLTPLSAQLALARGLPRSTLRIMPGVGHLVHYESVQAAATEVLGFLRAGVSA